MKPLDIFYYVLAAGFIILVIFISLAAYRVSQVFKSVKILIEDAKDIRKIGSIIGHGIVGYVISLISLFFQKGGVKNEKQ